MQKAIAVASIIVVLSFAFVGVQLSRQAPRGAEASPAPAPMLQTQPDGSLYSLDLQLSRFERRLIEEEKRSQTLLEEMAVMRQERAALEARLQEHQEEIRKLRRQLSEPPRPEQQPGNLPAGNSPSAIPPAPAPDGENPG